MWFNSPLKLSAVKNVIILWFIHISTLRGWNNTVKMMIMPLSMYVLFLPVSLGWSYGLPSDIRRRGT
jgi:hypothetical protein